MRRLLLTSICLTPLLAFSQDEEPAEIPAIVQPAPDIIVPPAPQAQQPAQLGDTLIEEPIVELKLTGTALADLYRIYTGRRVIVSSAAGAAEFQFIQPASPQDPLTYSEAAELLRKTATLENFIFVPASDDPNLDYLTLATAGTKPQGIGVGIYNEQDVLPDGDAVITYVMKLDYLKPDEAVRVFQQVVGQFGAFGSITASTSTSSVIITENTSLIRRLIELEEEIDKPISTVGTKFIAVQYADVTELATTLNELLGTQADASRPAGVERAQQNRNNNNNNQPAAGIPGDTAGAGAGSADDSPIQIIPDARTNRLFAMGRPVDILFVEGLVREFDTQSDQRNFLRRKLKFLAVSDFLPIAGDALTRAFSGTGEVDASQQGGNNNNNNNNRNNRNNNTNNNTGGTATTGGSGDSTLSDPNVTSAPESLLIGRTLLVADNITNSIVVQGPPSGVEIIERLLDQVDVKADQVMISTVFGQLTLSNDTSTGVDWLRAFRGNDNGGIGGSSIGGLPTNNILPSDIGSPFTSTTPLIDGAFPNQTGLSLYGQIGNSLGVFVNLLQADGNFTILSRPSIFTANNVRGVISSGSRIAIPTTTTQNTVGQPTTSIEFRDVVLKLEVIPLVNSEDEVTLQISLISDDIIDTSIINGDEIPIIGTREILTTVTVPNNQTVVLGGLITTTDTENVTGVPVLSSIPGLGRLFSTKTETEQRDELMIFIQPNIIRSSRSLKTVQEDMDARYEIAEPTRAFDAPAVLPPINTFPVAEPRPSTSAKATIVTEETIVTPVKKRRKLGGIHRR